jgi:hypothetical protein
VIIAGMTVAAPRSRTWAVAPAPVGSTEAAALLRDYYIDASDRYHTLHLGRPSTPAEIEQGLADSPSDDLAPPTGPFLLGRYGDAYNDHRYAEVWYGKELGSEATVSRL